MNKENGDFIKEVSMIKNCSLDYIQYIKKYGNDCAYSDRMIETLLKYADDLREKYNDKFNDISNKNKNVKIDSNLQLINNILITLNELKNYNLDDPNIVQSKKEISNLLNNKEGAKKLLDYFNEIKDNEQLEYLKEIQVINSESIDKIKDEYIPKLNDIINKNKNKSKDMER